MHRIKQLKTGIFFSLLFSALVYCHAILAEESETITGTKPEQSTVMPDQVANHNSTSFIDSLNQQFPHLQRALIITSIINLVVIIFGLMLFFAKRKMNQFNHAPLAKASQQD